MIRFNQAKVRPRSTRTITEFRGLWHNLEDQGQLTNQSAMRWYDERNLSSDAYPALTARRKPETVAEIDGNVITHRIIAAETSGDHPVLLDAAGILYCNGHSINTLGSGGIVYYAKMTHDETEAIISIEPDFVSTYDSEYLDGMLTEEPTTYDIKLSYAGVYDPATVDWSWMEDTGGGIIVIHSLIYTYSNETINGITYDTWSFTDLDLKLRADNWLDSGWKFTITTWSKSDYGDETHMVRMGANVIIFPEGIMVNAEKLAAGETVAIQSLNAKYSLRPSTNLLMYPCQMDGKIIAPVSGSTAPNDKTAIWADNTGEQTVMRQWVSALESWQAMQQTYVRIELGALDAASDRANDDIRQWDAITLKNVVPEVSYWDTVGGGLITDQVDNEIQYLINSTQLVVKRGYDPDATPPVNYIVVEGILDEAVYVKAGESGALTVERKMPQMDFVVECGNRLWGCYYGPNEEGTDILNEIYASKLGDPTNWQSYQGLSTDSWTASRGTPALFTGAAVLDNSPLFFREEWLEKVYPSSTGAHQIQTYSVDGVEKGSHRSLLVIDDKLYYKSRMGVMVYEGTLPRSISAAFGDWVFREGNAGRHGKRYEISMLDANKAMVTGVYDINSGDWHMETGGWEGCAFTWKDELYHSAEVNQTCVLHKRYGGTIREEWQAETGIISYELPEHKFVSCVRVRVRMPYTARFKAYIKYENDNTWAEKGSLSNSGAGVVNSFEFNIYPLRCDHFRLKFEGKNGAEVISISYRLERSEGGH
jgi:hypothetical protein